MRTLLFPTVSLIEDRKRCSWGFWVEEKRTVDAYQVDVDTASPTLLWLDRGADLTKYFYSVADDPNNGRNEFRSTAEPARWLHVRNHQGVAPHMLDPDPDRVLHGTVCVVEGTVTVDGELPRKDGDPSVDVIYEIQPLETELAPVADPVVVEIWDPAPVVSLRRGTGRCSCDGTTRTTLAFSAACSRVRLRVGHSPFSCGPDIRQTKSPRTRGCGGPVSLSKHRLEACATAPPCSRSTGWKPVLPSFSKQYWPQR